MPEVCAHGREKETCAECKLLARRPGPWEDDLSIDDEFTQELRAKGFKTWTLK